MAEISHELRASHSRIYECIKLGLVLFPFCALTFIHISITWLIKYDGISARKHLSNYINLKMLLELIWSWIKWSSRLECGERAEMTRDTKQHSKRKLKLWFNEFDATSHGWYSSRFKFHCIASQSGRWKHQIINVAYRLPAIVHSFYTALHGEGDRIVYVACHIGMSSSQSHTININPYTSPPPSPHRTVLPKISRSMAASTRMLNPIIHRLKSNDYPIRGTDDAK